MRCINKSFRLILGGILFLSLLAGCSGGGGGSSSETSSASTSKGVQSYEGYTDVNGIAEFTLSNGQKIQQKVIDIHTNDPIADAKVILFINENGESTVMVFDKNDVYAPTINSYNSSNETTAKSIAPVIYTIGLIKFHEARLVKESIADEPIVPLTQSKLPDGIDVAFLNKYGKYLYSTTLAELSNISPSTIYEGAKAELISELQGEVEDILTTILLDSKIKVAEVTGKIYENVNPVLEITESALNAQVMGSYIGNILRFKLLGYPPDTKIDVYRIAPAYLGFSKNQAYVRIMVPSSNEALFVSGFGAIFGQVTNDYGQPIPKAKIQLFSFDRPPASFWTALTDKLANTNLLTNKFEVFTSTDGLGFYTAGKFPIFGYVTTAYIMVTAPGYEGYSEKIQIKPDMSLQLNIKLQSRKGKTKIIVKDSNTQQPIENAAIGIYDSDSNGGFRGSTLKDGTYDFESSVGTYRVVVSKTGYIEREYNHIIDELGTPLYVSLDPLTTALPDLTVSTPIASTYSAGQSINVPVTVSRSGGNLTFAKNVEVGIYWSTDAVYSSSDLTLWYDNTNYTIVSLNTDGLKTVNVSFTIPSVSTGATSYIIAVVDKNNYHGESKELNNIAVYPVNVQASTNISPNQASNLKATALSFDRIVLYWNDNSDNETGFMIERRVGTTGSFSQITTVGSNVAYYEDSGLSPNTQYFYRVMAYNAYGDSASYSNEASATTLANTVLPTATTNSATNITSSSATLNGYINPNGVNTGYFFQYGTNSSTYGNLTASQIIGTTAGNYSTDITGLSPNTTYYFRIVAVAAGGTVFGSQGSSTTLSSTTGTKPGAFTLNVTAGCSGSSPENLLTWTASSGATGYYAVYRCAGSNCTPTLFWQNATAVPNTTFRNSSVTAGTPYTYFVRASNTYGYTDSNLATVTTRSDCGSTTNNYPIISSVIPNPYPPVNVGSTLNITCVASDPDGDALTYTWTSTGGNFSGSGSVVSWIAPSTAGTYSVNCSVSDGKGGNDSQGISISVISSNTNTPPIAPSNLVATALSQTNIALVWQDNSDNETGFKIERKTGATGTYSQITTVAAQTGSGSGVYYDDSGLIAGTTYCYRVRAYNTYDSSYSNENCAMTQAQQGIKPTAVTGSATNITSNSATLNGTVNPNGVATGAFFQYGTSTAFGYTTPSQVLGSGTNNVNVTANLTGLSANTVYYFRIVATNSLAETTFGTTQSFVTTSSSGSLPGSFTLSGTTECNGSSPANSLSWTASSGVASYAVYRCTGSGCTPTWYYNLATLGTTFTNTNVIGRTTYTYFIRATNSYGSTDSNWVTVSTKSICP